MNQPTVGRFFDSLSDGYSAALERCVPRYHEMLWALLDYLPQTAKVRRVLELGCGTGNLSRLLVDRFPAAAIRLVDVSTASLEVCRDRLGDAPQVVYENRDFRSLTYGEQSFDLVISSISIHHLRPAEKLRLFHNIHRWLNTDGIFAYADQFAGATCDLNENHLRHWKAQAFQAGTTEAEWEMWMQHQNEHDHHDSLVSQIDWLKDAGFALVDCPWRYLLWTVVQARKTAKHSEDVAR